MGFLFSVSRCGPFPAEIVFSEGFRAFRIGLVGIAERLSARIEIDAVGLDPDRSLADLAFIWRGAAATEIVPVVAVARRDAREVSGLEAVLVEFGLDFHHQLRRLGDRRQHLTKTKGALGPRWRGKCDQSQPCHRPLRACRHHDRNSLVYWVSWRRLARSARKVALPRSSSEACSAR